MRHAFRGALAAGLAFLAFPTSAQSPAAQPSLTAEQALQLFGEAGFTVVDGRPANRCGNLSNPRVAFVDLNGDGKAEAHIADVDPSCYGKPGAYFSLLAQGDDGRWRKLIAEDGIVGFQASRSGGWNDLLLEATDSACPGARRFNGTDYGAPTACSPAATASLASTEGQPAVAGGSGALTGSRADQIAQVLRNLVTAAQSRTWDAAMAAFSGARWQNRSTHAPDWAGSTNSVSGTILLGGAEYDIKIGGTANRVNEIVFDSPGDDLMEWEPIAAALKAQGVDARNIGCHSPTGFGWVALNVNGQRAVLHKSVNYGTAVASTDIYSLVLDDPFDGRTEAEIAADRSLC